MNLKALKRLKTGKRALLMLSVLSVFAIAAAACSSTTEATPEPTGTGAEPNTSQGISIGAPSTGGGVAVAPEPGFADIAYVETSYPSRTSFASVPTVYNNGQTSQVGIWVTGTGNKSVVSDVAKLYLAVESKEETVSEARQKAAEAMTAVLDAIRNLGVADEDIVTTSFNIYPQTIWVEVSDSLGRHSEPRITGYTVNNSVAVTVRNIDDLDEVIDTAADRGGDLIRVNSVSFTVANPEQHGAETRQLAAADARAKAQLYADAMGVTLGPLVFLTEIGSSAPLARAQMAGSDAAYAEEAFAPTPIQGGEVGLSTTIQAAFAIVP